MAKLVETEHHVDPDLARLEMAQTKRSKIAMKALPQERSLHQPGMTINANNRSTTTAGPSARPRHSRIISEKQQAHDTELINRFDNDNEPESGKLI